MVDTLHDYGACNERIVFVELIQKIKLVVLPAILAGFAFLMMPSAAQAEVGDTISFTPTQWRGLNLSGTDNVRTHRRSGRRAVAAAHAYDDGSRPQRRSSRPLPAPRESVGGGGVAWRASSSCLAGNLQSVIAGVASYGSVTVNSTCRSHSHNRRVGGASKSWHLTGQAADIRVHGNWRQAAAYLRSSVGGFKHYGGGLFHIDNGPNRSW